MGPNVDAVIVFMSSKSPSLSKQQARDDAKEAEVQYSRLLETLTKAGLRAVGRRGEKLGHLLVFVSCPKRQISKLVQRERHSDFLYGLPTSILPSVASDFEAGPITEAERIRLVHAYITATSSDGGLGITPGSKEWGLVESVMALHDKPFNELWLKNWTTRNILSVNVDIIRHQFGDAVALYFSFLSSYARALIFPAVFGLIAHFFMTPYSSIYSLFLVVWATGFAEWWRVRERVLSMRWGTRGSFKVEKHRAQYKEDPASEIWWKRDMRTLASLPVIAGFGALLAVLMTGIFVFEAFVSHLYTGPGSKFISFAPTVMFLALVPPITSIYQGYAQRFTAWENHRHQSAHEHSLTIKTFTLSAIVAYLQLALSAFVYVPFGDAVMGVVRTYLDRSLEHVDDAQAAYNVTGTAGSAKGWWEVDAHGAQTKLNAGRLQDQMFAYTVTNQVINTFLEIGLPYILRFVDQVRNEKFGKKANGKKKRVVFEEDEKGNKEEREFLETVRSEVALPEYELFGDYSEMVTQFGYVVLWSTIWPLAPVMALVNNFFELRSDAFKITVHQRRPVPVRTDTIGPWLDTLSFLAWLAALTNAALVYLFRPRAAHPDAAHETVLDHAHTHLVVSGPRGAVDTRELLIVASMVALLASHGHTLLRRSIAHVVEHVVWTGSREVVEAQNAEREVKERYLRSVSADGGNVQVRGAESPVDEADKAFWSYDEGLAEISRMVKDA